MPACHESFLKKGMLLILLFFVPEFVSAQAKPTNQKLQEVIDGLHGRYLEMLKQGDAAGLSELFCEDAFVLSTGSPMLRGRAHILRDRTVLFEKANILSGAIRTTHLEVSGFLAYEVGRFSYTIKIGTNPPRIVEGKYVTVWKQGTDGQWRYQVDAGVSD